ncbi:bifunctional phosphopantothenoylcysteine decarboxylase/phosphopantothenate--cysteine ligase CoaBC [Leeia sp. TBRC 13508]|uniref:Coenzyme A biosynthesis bifunctional protein CoaBC n=1 Tax=Leeia speluncae TaxID=2884804 RepID=A0ABS8D1W0_9NEIS|nr:bifunctional phosphopantothenoylcysteine decarboxylase/phosphopantothenate--cysteine ligase CoaBC [Leeia speluncae]MCB6182191.1 bifunctional phosphopantothenoylcysteine decarboxylase/phosphopantothenate--cysteine ligase CoaBC [Leeia speluncae]
MAFAIKHLVLGVTGGVAAYKAAELTRLLVKANVGVRVVLTEGGSQFVTPHTFQALSGRHVFTDLWDTRVPNGMAHIDLSREADAILVAPATADFMAKLVNGSADDLLSTLCLARECPLIIAPAMNRQMWENPATQRNVKQLRQDGVIILGPDSGEQACGETGMGRMLEPEVLMEVLDGHFQPKPLRGMKVMITAGPTFERIDAVRGITNQSSGKMGFSLARAARDAGAEVTLIAGPVSLPTPYGVKRIDVESANDMLNAVNGSISVQDVFIGVAAVADYHPLQQFEHKLKKDANILQVDLAPNPDILANVASLPRPPFCVGFAAESQNLLDFAEQKRRKKRLPLLAANLVQTAFNSDSNELILLDDKGRHPLPKSDKLSQARLLVQHIGKMMRAEPPTPVIKHIDQNA